MENSNKDSSDEPIKESLNDSNRNKSFQMKGILNYEGKEQKSVFKILGIEMTAPSELKNPRIIYMGFIIVNFVLFFLLINFVANQ